MCVGVGWLTEVRLGGVRQAGGSGQRAAVLAGTRDAVSLRSVKIGFGCGGCVVALLGVIGVSSLLSWVLPEMASRQGLMPLSVSFALKYPDWRSLFWGSPGWGVWR